MAHRAIVAAARNVEDIPEWETDYAVRKHSAWFISHFRQDLGEAVTITNRIDIGYRLERA